MQYLRHLVRAVLLGALLTATAFAADTTKKTYDIAAGDAAVALKQFSATSGRETLFAADAVRGVKTAAVKGELTAQEAIDALLSGTGLVATVDTSGAIAVRRGTPVESKNAPSRPADRAAADASDAKSSAKLSDGVVRLDTYEVFGRKSINADLPRTRDDVQPYVVFDREVIDRSMATNLEDFFRMRLPMNQTFSAAAQSGSSNASSINLRGLGPSQTLILVDGRRLPNRVAAGGLTTQADLNGIPLGMIERVEILPSTASGIYGGGATGGVINIITRKDYSGVEASMTYLNTFDTDAYTRRIELNGSFQLEGGRTMLTINAAKIDGSALSAQDRDLVPRGLALQLANNRSAFYGFSPPQGYTTNIQSANGSNLVLKSGAALNSPYTFVPVGYAGTATDGGTALVANAGRFNLDLPDTLTGRRSAFLTVPDQESYGVSLRRRFGDRVEVMVDASRFDNRSTRPSIPGGTVVTLPATAPNNPFTTPILISTSAPKLVSQAFTAFSRSDRFLAGAVVKLPHDWSAGLDFVRSKSISSGQTPQAVLGDPDGAAGSGISYTTALANGTLDAMRDLNVYPLDYGPYLMPNPSSRFNYRFASDEYTLRASGPLYRLLAGNVTLSASAQYREEEIPGAVVVTPSLREPVPSYSWEPPLSLERRAYYAELQVPVFAATAPDGWRRGLDLQFAARRDESSATARASSSSIALTSPDGPFPSVTYVERDYSATKATIGFKYSPLRDLMLRASWGTGFLAPTLNQLGTTSPFNSTITAVDPKRGNLQVTTPVVIQSGGNPDLQPENSESVSAGVVITPRFVPGLRLAVDVTRIEKTNEIGSLSVQQFLDFEDRVPGRVVRAPLTAADQALGYTGGVLQQFVTTTMNIAGKRVTAYDFQADYTLKTATRGEFQAYASATYQPDFETKAFRDLPYVELVGTVSQLTWRGNGGLNWTKNRLSLGWNMQYYDSYLVYSRTSAATTIAQAVLNQGSSEIPSQIYHDLQLGYRWGGQQGWRKIFANTQLTLGVQNVFNKRPPTVATSVPSALGGAYSTFGDPRLSRYTISVRRRF